MVILPEHCGELAHAWELWAFHSSVLSHSALAFPVAQRHHFGRVPSSPCCFRTGSGLGDFRRRLALTGVVWWNCRTAAWSHPAGHLEDIGSHFVAVAVRADPGIRCSGSLGRIGSH